MYSEQEALALLHVSVRNSKAYKDLINSYGSAIQVLNHINLEITAEHDKALLWLERFNIKIITCSDPNYPSALHALAHPPFLLYLRGNFAIIPKPALAIIGTRQPSLYGKEMAKKFSQSLASLGITIVSGLARGIDTEAHRATLEVGKTIAVLGSGLGHIYPKENSALAEKIIDEGGSVLSELPIDAEPLKHHFPQRNRIVAGLSSAILLIESAQTGGGMLTMQFGHAQGKKLFTIPGRADLATFGGNHLLLKQGVAQLVEQPEEIAPYFNLTYSLSNAKGDSSLNDEEKYILRQLKGEEKTLDTLVLLTQYPIMKLNVLLTRLVLKKIIKEYPGKIYRIDEGRPGTRG